MFFILLTESLHLWLPSSNFPYSYPSSLVRANLVSFSEFFSVCVCFKYNWPKTLFYCYTTSWLDISIHFIMFTTISLVMIYHHMMILYYYWLYSLHCTFNIPDSFILQMLSTYLFISLTYFSPPPIIPPVEQPPACFLYNPVSVLLYVCSFVCFLDSTCKWNHSIFLFLCVTYFT